MRRLILIFCMTGGTLAAQSSADSPEDSSSELARDFYNTYLDSLPDPRIQRKELLELNLIKSLKRILPREDPFDGKEVADGLQPSQLHYSRMTRSDPFVRGILKEISRLKEEDFMFIVRFGPYMAFVCYRADPHKYRIDETDNYILIKKKDAPSSGKNPSTEDRGKDHNRPRVQ